MNPTALRDQSPLKWVNSIEISGSFASPLFGAKIFFLLVFSSGKAWEF